MHFVDRIRQIKIILVVAAIVIAVASLVVSHYLIRDLQKAEIKNVEVWAEAMRALNDADENTDLNLVFKVINGNSNIIKTEHTSEILGDNSKTFNNTKLRIIGLYDKKVPENRYFLIIRHLGT